MLNTAEKYSQITRARQPLISRSIVSSAVVGSLPSAYCIPTAAVESKSSQPGLVIEIHRGLPAEISPFCRVGDERGNYP